MPGDVWFFHSRPDLQPAAVTITKRDPAATGDIFLAPQIGPLQQGPELIGPNGGLIWFDPVPVNDAATDFREQYYNGQPVLTWWQGNEAAGVGSGEDIIVNSSYQEIKVVTAGNGLTADLHEFQLTPRGTALITAAFPVVVNASSVKGSSQEVVLDAVVQEIDIATGLVVFQWDSLDHVPLTASYSNLPTKAHTANNVASPFDYFHVNSIEPDKDGNLLISGRNTWAVYKVNRSTGAVIWTLGGKSSSFRLGPGASFAFQHDVRVQAFGDQFLTMFDDGAGPPYVHSQSRALKLELNLKQKTANIVSQRVHSPPLLSSYEGNDEQLPDRNDFVGWGQQPYFSQYNAQGKLVFDGRFVDDNISYRAYRFQWSGTPANAARRWPPPATARKMTVYVSWNGATSVDSWRVFGGSSATALKPVVTARKSGFETAITTGARGYVAVQALGFKNHPLGSRSAVAQVPPPPPPTQAETEARSPRRSPRPRRQPQIRANPVLPRVYRDRDYNPGRMRRRIRSAAFPVHRHSVPQLLVDGVLVALAYYLAFRLRFEDGLGGTNDRYGDLLTHTIWWAVPVTLVVLAAFGQYQRLWTFVGQRDYEAVVKGVVVSTLVIVGAIAFLHPVTTAPTVSSGTSRSPGRRVR